ncbi:MAG: hypothetical protein K9M54_09100 [Kiritimatiellales bacterium]|nr:hypothetical protein [Kiritimatiellales bacterium]
MKKRWIGIVLALCSGSAMATVIFQDSFDSNSGALAGRTPDVTTNGVNWSLASSANLTVTNGVLMTKASAISSAWLYLPDIATGDVIRVSAVIVGNVALNTQYIAIGLTTSAGALYLKGAPYVTMKHGGTTGEERGFFNIYGGLGNSNQIDTNPYLVEATGYTTNLNARNTVNFEYDTASGNMTAWLVSEGGTVATQYVGSVNYGGVADAVIPIDLITFLSLQFTTGAINTSANPAYLDNLLVEIISAAAPPEPEPVIPASIVGWSVVSSNLMRMVVDAPSTASNYYPKSTANLASGTWAGVAHSDDGLNPFVVTNLDYAGAEGTNKVIFVQATNAAGFFGIGGQ